jgi:hypothetical protein
MAEEETKNQPIDANVKLYGKFEFMAMGGKTKRKSTKKTKV